MRLVICDTVDYVAEWSAKYVLKRINDFQPNENKYFVLGLPTGMYYCIYYYLLCITNRKEKEKERKIFNVYLLAMTVGNKFTMVDYHL